MKPNIITGQQIGLLGGPLYTTYKVLGAINHAEAMKGQAIYWLETNDADFNEINQIDYINKAGELKSLKWNIDSLGFSCGYIPVDDRLVELLSHFFSDIHQTEHTTVLKKMVLDCYRPGIPLGDASQRLAKSLFSNFELSYFDPHDPDFRDYSKKILLQEAEREADGNQCNLFYLDSQQRKAIFKRNGLFYDRNDQPLDLNKQILLPNVKTRNLCQDGYFDTHTYIAGPGEIKYIDKLDPYYKYHGIRKSRVLERMHLILIEPRIARLLKKLDLIPSKLLEVSKEQMQKRIMQQSGFDQNRIREQSDSAIHHLINELEETGLDTKGLRKILTQEVKKRIGEKRQQFKLGLQSTQKGIDQVYDALKPYENKQERVFNLFYYMNLYGGLAFIEFLNRSHRWDSFILEVNSG